jgi:hypothetical protein
MQQWTHIKEDASEEEYSLVLVVDAELFRLDSVIRWLDAADGRLKRANLRAAPQPSSPMPKLRRRAGARR